jgi:regulator of sigma E protease
MMTIEVVPMIAETSGWRRKNTRQVGLLPAVTPLVLTVTKDSPADQAGVKSGDIVMAVNGTRIFNALSLVDEIEKHPTDEITLDIRRGAESSRLKMRPVPLESEGVTKPRIGVEWDNSGQLSLSHPDPVEQVYNSITSTLQTIGAVASPKSDVKLQHMSGPVMIVRIYYMLFEGDSGWKLALWFSVILNVNLAILNMLPIPVLDGGHIVLAIIKCAPQTGQYADPRMGPDGVRHLDHRLHALHQLLRHRGFVRQEQRPQIAGKTGAGESANDARAVAALGAGVLAGADGCLSHGPSHDYHCI